MTEQDVNAEFARLMAQTEHERAIYTRTQELLSLSHRTGLQLMQETQRIAKRDRWLIPFAEVISVVSAVVSIGAAVAVFLQH